LDYKVLPEIRDRWESEAHQEIQVLQDCPEMSDQKAHLEGMGIQAIQGLQDHQERGENLDMEKMESQVHQVYLDYQDLQENHAL